MGQTTDRGSSGGTLELAGTLDVRRTAEVRTQVYALLERTTGDVVVDISRVDSMDMTTLKLFAVANRVAERRGRRVVLRGASPGVRRLLHLSHLRWMIPVEPAEALAAPEVGEPPATV
jgi:anti-anti-sigma factor